jgi:hypothetical protein
MPKKSIAEKSVYWLKVISLGLIVGIGIQFAKAWTNPSSPAPASTIGGPITNNATAQYKTGMLGVNSAVTPTNALEVGGAGNAYIGGSVFTGGSINATSGQISGVLSSGKVQIVDVVTESAACAPNGLVAKDSNGILLSCQGPGALKWKKASGSTGAPCDYYSTPLQSGQILLVGSCVGSGRIVVQCMNGTITYPGCAIYDAAGGAG